MNIDEFTQQFTQQKLDYTLIGEEYYLVNDACKELVATHMPQRLEYS